VEHVIHRLNHWIQTMPKEYNAMSETELSYRAAPNKWSKKEIAGHLCDSAVNNIVRFVKIQYEKQPYAIHKYNQEQWVTASNYQDRPIDDILTLFQTLNKQVIDIITNMPAEKLSYLCDIGNNDLKTFKWLIEDYLDHMEHHIYNQILIKYNA
jgi:AAA15 family ATPase/GTPase